jgi:hypothetical protein
MGAIFTFYPQCPLAASLIPAATSSRSFALIVPHPGEPGIDAIICSAARCGVHEVSPLRLASVRAEAKNGSMS